MVLVGVIVGVVGFRNGSPAAASKHATPVDARGQTVGEDVTTQTHQVMRNLKIILEAAGTTMDRVVRTTVFYTHREDYAALDTVYRQYFTGTWPSRSAVIAAGLVRPEWRIEIDAIAMIPPDDGGGRDA